MNKIMDFYADWCAPCKSLEPHLKAAEIRGVVIERINVETEKETARLFGVSTLPTLLFFTDDRIVKTIIGSHSDTPAQIQAFSGD
jgi:thioredoxin 1